MTCYDCGATVKTAIRQFREAKDRRFKAGFRNVCETCCETCYERTMKPRVSPLVDFDTTAFLAGLLLSQPKEQPKYPGKESQP